jgi:hypothetical protein
MNTPAQQCLITAGLLLLAVLTAGCVVPGDTGYGYGGGDVGVSYGVNFYEPYDNYGGWGPGYLVGPPRGGDRRRPDYRPSNPNPHSYRSAPSSHGMPTIPSRSRSDGGHGH